MTRRPYVEGEQKYQIRDYHSRMLFRKVFVEKHSLRIYSYKGQNRMNSFCSDDRALQGKAWIEFVEINRRMQKALTRAVEKYINKHVTCEEEV